MDKHKKLQLLQKKLERIKNLPLISSKEDVVFGEGNPDATVMFIGEAAGYWESVKRRPFVGPSGKVLDRLIESIGLVRSEVYITSVIKSRPPNNRDPKPEEIEAHSPYLDAQIEIIGPKIIVTLGRFSLNKFLPDVKISQVHGKPFKIIWQGKQRVVIPMYHPAAGLRRIEVMKKLKKDFKIIKKILDKLRKSR